MVDKVSNDVLAKLSERLTEDAEKLLAPETSNSKINCWACGNYDSNAAECYQCQQCNLWTLKKIFLHNKRYLRYLDLHQLHLMGFSGI